MRIARAAPPRFARVGSASRAARTLPKWLNRERNVRGPTFSERISRNQSIRSSSVSSGTSRGLLVDLAFGAVREARDVGAVHEQREQRKHDKHQGLGGRADEPEDH